ncbi:MAG: hypothetical protein JO072_11575 [Parafilimonas sp.]|nr:hypothetical protein [Parafilimonas sp.]
MKSICFLFAGLFFLLLSTKIKAQTTGAEYFEGKWNVLIKGTPNGDARMFVSFQKQDTALIGTIQDSTGQVTSKIDKVELDGDKIVLYFNVQGYDVNLEMDKKDDNHVTGNVMGMFDAEGERVEQQ